MSKSKNAILNTINVVQYAGILFALSCASIYALSMLFELSVSTNDFIRIFLFFSSVFGTAKLIGTFLEVTTKEKTKGYFAYLVPGLALIIVNVIVRLKTWL